jgi:DNA-binding transcriptional LysR family regulator
MTASSRFDLNQLRVIAALAQTRHVTQAASLLGMSQSGFSTALARLRRQLGDALFVRTPEGMEPTPHAELLIEEVGALLAAVESKIRVGVSFDPREASTEFRMAMSDISEMALLPGLLSALRREAPLCAIRTLSLPPHAMASGLESGQIDLALGYIPDLKSAGMFQQQLFTHGFNCLLRADHPIRARKLTRQQYEQLEHVVVLTPIRSQDLVERVIAQRRIHRRIALQTPHFMSLPFIIAGTDLCATVPAAVGSSEAASGAIRMVEPPFPTPRFAVKQYWHRRFNADQRSRWLRDLVYRTLRAN